MKHGHHLESPEEIQKITNHAHLTVEAHNGKQWRVKKKAVYLIVPE